MHFGYRWQKTADHPYNADCSCMQCEQDRIQGVTKDGDMSTSDLEQDGGKLQPEDGPPFKKKRRDLDKETLG